MYQNHSRNIENCKLIVITGGPGAGKTAVLEAAKKILCPHAGVLPESASIIFNGGFWRKDSFAAKKAAQRAIFSVQRELETIVLEEKEWAIGLCDRGSLDSLAYWPASSDEFFSQFKTSLADELNRYASVIHLRTPDVHNGYNHLNPIRIETATQAIKIDKKIEEIWQQHPRYHSIPSSKYFIEKFDMTLELIKKEIEKCCPSLKPPE